MASYARRFILHNVRLVGGCCGTTPEHIRQIKAAVRGAGAGGGDAVPARRRPVAARARRADGASRRRCARAEKSRLAHALARGAFVVGVELLPPRGYRTDAAARAGARS